MTVPAHTHPRQGLGRMARVGGSLLVALVLIVSAWWVAGREGLSDLGAAGMNSSLLPSVGDPAPDFTVPDPLGNMHTLADYRGQPVWLNFWGSWCPPCRAEMPDVQAAYAQLQPQGLVLLAISLREPATEAQRFATRSGATFTILSDPTLGYTDTQYPIRNFPTHIFINRDGSINRIVLANLSTEQALQYAQEIIDS